MDNLNTRERDRIMDTATERKQARLIDKLERYRIMDRKNRIKAMEITFEDEKMQKLFLDTLIDSFADFASAYADEYASDEDAYCHNDDCEKELRKILKKLNVKFKCKKLNKEFYKKLYELAIYLILI